MKALHGLALLAMTALLAACGADGEPETPDRASIAPAIAPLSDAAR